MLGLTYVCDSLAAFIAHEDFCTSPPFPIDELLQKNLRKLESTQDGLIREISRKIWIFLSLRDLWQKNKVVQNHIKREKNEKNAFF